MNNIKRLVSILQEKLEKYCKNIQEKNEQRNNEEWEER